MAMEIIKIKTMQNGREIKSLKFLMIIFISVLMFSCLVPMSKESYLQNFEKFVERVKKNHQNYNAKDWKYADSVYDKYCNNWYRKYEDDFTVQEKLEVVKLKLLYQNYKEPDVIKDLLRNFNDDDAAQIKKKFDRYIEEDFDEDVDKLIEGMKEIGDSAVKVVEDLVEKIDNRF